MNNTYHMLNYLREHELLFNNNEKLTMKYLNKTYSTLKENDILYLTIIANSYDMKKKREEEITTYSFLYRGLLIKNNKTMCVIPWSEFISMEIKYENIKSILILNFRQKIISFKMPYEQGYILYKILDMFFEGEDITILQMNDIVNDEELKQLKKEIQKLNPLNNLIIGIIVVLVCGIIGDMLNKESAYEKWENFAIDNNVEVLSTQGPEDNPDYFIYYNEKNLVNTIKKEYPEESLAKNNATFSGMYYLVMRTSYENDVLKNYSLKHTKNYLDVCETEDNDGFSMTKKCYNEIKKLQEEGTIFYNKNPNSSMSKNIYMYENLFIFYPTVSEEDFNKNVILKAGLKNINDITNRIEF